MPQSVPLAFESDFLAWRAWARCLLHEGVSADALQWDIVPPPDLFAAHVTRALPEGPSPVNLPRPHAALFPAVVASGIPERFTLLYRLLEAMRDQQAPLPDDHPLLQQAIKYARRARSDALTLRQCLPQARLSEMAIRRVEVPASLLETQARALCALRPTPWLIRTPGRILLHENSQLVFAPDLPPERLETGLHNDDVLIEHARQHGQTAQHNAYWQSIVPCTIPPTPRFIKRAPSLDVLRTYAVDCGLCPLCSPATRTVFGEGNPAARLLFVGEQPGDQEDLQGRPFVGPAGQLFDRALHEAGGQRDETWISNAVKHFRFFNRNGRRIHQKPEATHIHACSSWLAAERALIRPQVTVMLGVTGASAILGRQVTISRERSRLFSLSDGSTGLVTVHPSFLLRQPDDTAREREYVRFVSDLKLALSALA